MHAQQRESFATLDLIYTRYGASQAEGRPHAGCMRTSRQCGEAPNPSASRKIETKEFVAPLPQPSLYR